MSKEFIAQYRIYYEDTDAGRIVYYANYLKFFERARTDLLRQQNISQTELINQYNLIFVVTNCNIKYIKGAKLDDLVTIKTRINEIKPVTISMTQEMFLQNTLLNTMDVKIACINAKSNKPTKIPTHIINNINV
jgi:acyl-CoA thioester hydrolase